MASVGTMAIAVGQADLNLGEVLVFPQNKIQLTTKIMSICGECEQQTKAFERFCACNDATMKSKHLGNLTLWFRLTCELEVLKSYASQSWFIQPNVGHTQSKENGFCEESPKKNKYKTRKSHRKEGKEATEIDVNNHKVEPPSTQKPKSSISIDIVRMKMNAATLDENDDVKQICIEYSFLGYRKLRTKSQVLEANEINFNFNQTFSIESSDERNFHRLKYLLKETERSIKLNLINTTPANVCDENDMSLGNAEIGFGLLHLGKLVKNWFGSADTLVHTIEIPILSKKPPYQNIGHLEVNIEGILLLKQIQQMDETPK